VVSKKTDFTAAAIIDNFASEATTASVERVMKQLATEKASAIMATREPSLPSPTFITAYLTAFRPSPPPALPANPSTGDNTLSLAFSALEARDFPHALSLFHESLSQGISTSAGKAAALNMRATFKFIMSDAEGALKDLDEATETEKGNAQSWVKKASVHMELGRPEEAMKDFERALEIDPENADVFVTISSPSFPPFQTDPITFFSHRRQLLPPRSSLLHHLLLRPSHLRVPPQFGTRPQLHLLPHPTRRRAVQSRIAGQSSPPVQEARREAP
jgi:tetratricopeptide (TPR) repeat protein